jgi:hypothetical protein
MPLGEWPVSASRSPKRESYEKLTELPLPSGRRPGILNIVTLIGRQRNEGRFSSGRTGLVYARQSALFLILQRPGR